METLEEIKMDTAFTRSLIAIGAAATVAASATAGVELWNNGPLVTYPGEGAGGADVSSISPGLNNYGVNLNQPSFRRADNFTVGAGGWRITTFEAFAYQTGSPTESSMTGLFIRVWSGVPGVDPGISIAPTAFEKKAGVPT